MRVNHPPTLLRRLLDAWHRRILIFKAASYAAVGVINALIDFSVFWVAVQYLGAPIIPANVMSWSVAITNSYIMNSTITFARESNRQLRWSAYSTFVMAGIVGLVVNTTTLLTALHLMPRLIDDATWQLAAAKLCAILASFVVNFSLSYFVVFRKRA